MSPEELDFVISSAVVEYWMDNGREDLCRSGLNQAFIVAQARHESANYASHLFKVQNNAFGYGRVVGSPFQLSGGSIFSEVNMMYANYYSVRDSAREIAAYWLRNGRDVKLKAALNTDEYAAALKSFGYYTDTLLNYQHGLSKWFNKINSVVITVRPFHAIVILLMGFYSICYL